MERTAEKSDEICFKNIIKQKCRKLRFLNLGKLVTSEDVRHPIFTALRNGSTKHSRNQQLVRFWKRTNALGARQSPHALFTQG